MTDTSVDAPSPPTQEPELIAEWGEDDHHMRLDDQGSGIAAATMWTEGQHREVARISYSEDGAIPPVRWNWHGTMALAQFRRDAWDTQFYKEIALWLRSKAETKEWSAWQEQDTIERFSKIDPMP